MKLYGTRKQINKENVFVKQVAEVFPSGTIQIKWANEMKEKRGHNSEAGVFILIFQVKCSEARWEAIDILKEFSVIQI
jgi:hypothetical protein